MACFRGDIDGVENLPDSSARCVSVCAFGSWCILWYSNITGIVWMIRQSPFGRVVACIFSQ
jgi:hypothetical protein